ncbi:MAG: DUF3795 domain-containing protein [Candidatus Cloacimonetes bacterium]|nr:DUF3795 domain-containing protein [Candidatus Cloacimonadota bacterium]
MSVKELGCCGAYCKTCPAFRDKSCPGCKLGYQEGRRDISKAKCKMKVCCFRKQYISCADCNVYDSCPIILEFFGKKGYKYKKYREALDYIRKNGYAKFIRIASNWKIQYGRYD